MARGKKYPADIKEIALAHLATNNNIAEVSKELNIHESTLRTWMKDPRNDEFTELRHKKRAEFVDKAWEIIELGQGLIVAQLKEYKDKKIPIDVGKLSTVVGTMYDKQALANGDPTEQVGITVENLLKKVEDEREY